MFAVGDKVVYPAHGAGIIEAIVNRDFLGAQREYYVLKMCFGDMRVSVPVESVNSTGIRQIVDQVVVERVFSILVDEVNETEDNWSRRYRNNMEKIKSGDIHQVAEVVRNLMARLMSRGLSSGERKMLDYARRVLISELMLVRQESEDAVTEAIDALFAVET